MAQCRRRARRYNPRPHEGFSAIMCRIEWYELSSYGHQAIARSSYFSTSSDYNASFHAITPGAVFLMSEIPCLAPCVDKGKLAFTARFVEVVSSTLEHVGEVSPCKVGGCYTASLDMAQLSPLSYTFRQKWLQKVDETGWQRQ